MIIKQEENKIFSTGQVIETGISLEDVIHLKTLFSGGLYKDKYSFIAEMVQNATDVHKLIGTDKLVEVYFDRDEMGDYLAIQDFGTGISPELMENVISKFGASTKRDSDLFHGGKGIGYYSILAYTDKSFLITVNQGVKYEYMLTKESGAKFFLLSKIETDEPNGTIIKVHLKKNYREMEYMKDAIHKKIVYFDGIHYEDFRNPLIKHETFWYTSDFREVNKDMHIQYNGYYYPIDWNIIKTTPIQIPVAIPFEIGELEVVASREEIQYNFKTIELLTQRITNFLEYAQSQIDFNYYDFVKYYRDKRSGAFNLLPSLRVTFESIGVENKLIYVPLKDLTLKTDLPDLSIKIINKTRIDKCSEKLFNFGSYNLYIADIVNPLSKKYFRSYMQNKYVLYISEWKMKDWIDFLCLKRYPKEKWREKIELYKTWFIKQFKVVLMSDVLKSKEFLDYEETEKKNLQKVKSVTPPRKKVKYVARWATNNIGEVVFDSRLDLDDRPILTVTTETPKAKVQQLFQIAHKKYNIVKDKVEDYKHIESTQLVADVYYSIVIHTYLQNNKPFIRYIENVFPKEFACFKKLDDFVTEYFPYNIGAYKLEKDLLEWVTLYDLKNSMEDVLEECYKVQEKYVYIKLLADVYEYYQYKDEKIKTLITFIESIKK